MYFCLPVLVIVSVCCLPFPFLSVLLYKSNCDDFISLVAGGTGEVGSGAEGPGRSGVWGRTRGLDSGPSRPNRYINDSPIAENMVSQVPYGASFLLGPHQGPRPRSLADLVGT